MSDGTGDLLGLLEELIAARTVNPPGSESAAAAVVEKFFKSCRVPYSIHEKAPGRANIIGRIGSGRPVLLIASHLDTVPAGDGWASDPFSLRVDGNRAYGRGVNDNKGPLAGSLLAARRIFESGMILGGTLLVAGVADEERGNEYGVRYLLRETGLEADFVIAPDSAGHLEEIDVAEKGCVFAKLVARGKSVHGSRPADGVNAVAALSTLLDILSQSPPPSPPHPHFSPATLNIGTVSGGTAPNIVPDFCEAQLDFRTLPGTSAADVRAFLGECIRAAKERHPEARFEIEMTMTMPPHEVQQKSVLVEACQSASRRLFGRQMRPLYQGGVTIAKEFALAGIPAVSLGPGSSEAFHQVDEWIEIDELQQFVDFLVEVAREVLPGRP